MNTELLEVSKVIASDRVAFSFGAIIVSQPVDEALHVADWVEPLRRHLRCDWGLVSRLEWLRNDLAIGRGEKLISVHETDCELAVVIVTSCDRRTTTIHLHCEY